MNRNTFLALCTGLLFGFLTALVSVPHLEPMLNAQEKQNEKPEDPVVRELQGIQSAISDRHSPVVKKLEDIADELGEIAEMKRTLEDIERNMDE